VGGRARRAGGVSVLDFSRAETCGVFARDVLLGGELDIFVYKASGCAWSLDVIVSFNRLS
jgi:hypothetical protein